jgi:DNA-directed RNA polymerase
VVWRREIRAREKWEKCQFAAACLEFVAADTHGATYETHLPVWLDASSNGLQHLAIIREDVKLAAMVNLEARSTERSLEVHDIYETVARHARQTLQADDDPASRFWVKRNNLRDLLKQPIMTLPYGVTKPGMLDQIKEACEKLKIDAPSKAMVRLRHHIWQAIEEKLPGAMETREYILRTLRNIAWIAGHTCNGSRGRAFLLPTAIARARRDEYVCRFGPERHDCGRLH